CRHARLVDRRSGARDRRGPYRRWRERGGPHPADGRHGDRRRGRDRAGQRRLGYGPGRRALGRQTGAAGEGWPATPPPSDPRARLWRRMFVVSLAVEGLLALLAFAPAELGLYLFRAPVPTLHSPVGVLLGEAATIAALSTVTFAVLVALTLRLVWRLVRPGWHGEDGSLAWALWFSEDLKQGAGGALFSLYASLYPRSWLRLAGVSVGRRSEISTSTGLNPLVSFAELAQATDDVGFCNARARDGWLHVGGIE